jgi:type II secretory pathway pseudopilin PulG
MRVSILFGSRRSLRKVCFQLQIFDFLVHNPLPLLHVIREIPTSEESDRIHKISIRANFTPRITNPKAPAFPHPRNRSAKGRIRGGEQPETDTAIRQRQAEAFTLIELLVVITIIIILMGLLFPVFRGVQDQAKKVQAKNDLIQIVTAVNAFYTEYGHYPQPAGNPPTADTAYGDGNNSGTNKSYVLMDCLMSPPKNSSDSNAIAQNPRQIAFLQPKSVNDPLIPRGGLDSNGNFYDPWGRTYAVVTDNSYDNVTQTYIPQYADIASSYSSEPSSGLPGISGGAIGYSFGKDGKQGTNGDKKYKGSDDVLSWQ